MKIRIKGNSIRLRLSKTDIRQLRENGIVSESTAFGGSSTFVYALEIRERASSIGASFSEGRLLVWLPSEQALLLTDTSQMGVEARQPTGEKDDLFLLIEKDLQCLENSREDQSDMFDNPKKSC